MVELSRLVEYLDEFLDARSFSDYAPNGLQVEGRPEVGRVVSGVTASRELIERAVTLGADALLVHHGYFWKGEDSPLVGIKRLRLKRLLENDISLLAYHLPLDAHPEVGNNVLLARALDLEIDGPMGSGSGAAVALRGRLGEPLPAPRFSARITERLGREPLVVPGGPATVETIGWCTGAAQDGIEVAASLGLDAYLSGEISERTVHVAREAGIHYFAAGHHATERLGVAALGAHLAERFGLWHEFVDIDNPA